MADAPLRWTPLRHQMLRLLADTSTLANIIYHVSYDPPRRRDWYASDYVNLGGIAHRTIRALHDAELVTARPGKRLLLTETGAAVLAHWNKVHRADTPRVRSR